jgi:TRAP transporter TAXI family solute receptor
MRRSVIVALFSFVSLVSLSAVSYAKDRKVMTIATGGVNGVYYPAGGAICRLVNRSGKEHGYHCYAESTGGSIANIHALRNGDVDFAIAQSDWQYKAYRGEGVFADAGPYNDIRSILSLHSEMLTVAAAKNSGITKFSDLKGKRVNIGDAASGMHEVVATLAGAHGAIPDHFSKTSELKPAEAVRALCAGEIDAMVVPIGHPNGLIQEATSSCGAKLIAVDGKEVDGLLANNPYYTRALIPAGMYLGNKQNIATFGVRATLTTSASMDEEAVYQLTKAVFDNFEAFKTLHFVFATLDRQHAVSEGLLAPIHPGALRYYKEVGLMK